MARDDLLDVLTKDLRPGDEVVAIGTVVSVERPDRFVCKRRDGTEEVIEDSSPDVAWKVDRPASVLAEAVLADAVRRDPPRPALPVDSSVRKRTPLCTGLIDYFPGALNIVSQYGALDPDVLAVSLETLLLQALQTRGDNGVSEYATICHAALAILHRELSGDLPPALKGEGLGELFEAYAAELSEVAQVSWHGNEKHNPGLPLHHARGKSTDHADCIARHVIDNAVDPGGYDGPMRHAACLVWRAFALAQEACEARGAPMARGARAAT